jgi:hypothetical protein
MALLQWNSSPVPIAVAAIETRFHRVTRRIDVVVASPFSAVHFFYPGGERSLQGALRLLPTECNHVWSLPCWIRLGSNLRQ